MGLSANILIVEDERVIAFQLAQQLEALGYGVVGTLASGEMAMQRLAELKPDLILMDINIEGPIDGIEAALRIRAMTATPVVFLTAYAEEATLNRARKAAPYGYLIKPCGPSELHATLQMALSRRDAELEAERGRDQLQLAMDAASFGVWEWEAGTGALTFGGQTSTLFGNGVVPIGESLETFLDRVHPDDRERVAAQLERAVIEGVAVNTTFRFIRHGDSEGRLEVHAQPQSSRPGGHARLIGVIQDVTERHVIEDRLRQASAVFDATAEAIFIMDRERRILSVNPAFLELTGWVQDDVLGRDPDSLFHIRRHSDQFYVQLEAKPDGVWQGETYFRHGSGSVFPAWESISVVRDAEGQVTHFVGAFADLSALRRAEAELNHLAHHDLLTGLPNRLLFNDRLDHLLSQAERRQNDRFAILFLDIDGFKVINDTLGHTSGDLLLQTVAARLKVSLRASDTAARMGGDEFVAILENVAQPQDAARIAHKLLDVIAQPIELNGDRFRVSASVGVAIFPDNGGDRPTLLKAAETAMYQAKTMGRNRCCFYTEKLATQVEERLNIEQGLRRALDLQALVLHYQPLVDLAVGEMVGLEALVRWPTENGFITPDRFIPVAEDTGVIVPLGEWVLKTACREALAWFERTGQSLRLAVNVSVRQLTHEHFPEQLARALVETGFPAQSLELEITESTLQVIEHSQKALLALKALGVSIAIDDFGTGYSSLSVLKHLPIDRVKIDRSFVCDMPDDNNDVGIVEAIVAMSRTLGFELVAEGIETELQLEILRKLGCNEGQGYLFSRPLPLNDLTFKRPAFFG